MGFRFEGLFCPSYDGFALEIPENLEDSADYLPVVLHRRLDRHQEGLLARGSAPPFSSVSGTPGMGIIDFDMVLEFSTGFCRVRGAEDLLLQIVGGGVANAQASLEFQGGEGLLALGEPIHGLELSSEGEVAGLAYRSHHDGGLVPTRLTLEKPVLGQEIGFASATPGAVKPIRPFGLHHGLQSLFLGAISGLKSSEGHTRLELNAVDCHGTPLKE